MELASSDVAAVLFFLKEEKEKNGAQSRGATNGLPDEDLYSTQLWARYPCAIASQTESKRTAFFSDGQL